MKNKKIWMWVILIFVVMVVAGGIKAYYSNNSEEERIYDDFAKCLTEKGIAMGGSPMCSHCNAQKELFGNSFQYIEYHICDIDEWCLENSITGYPTWVFSDGGILLGKQSLQTLSDKSGCELP